MKDYSHIKPGMYVLISELGDKKEEVLEAFCSAVGKGSCDPDFYPTELYLGVTEEEDVFNTYIDTYGDTSIDTYINTESFGSNNKLVTVDFILNGGDNKVIEGIKIEVGDIVKVIDNVL